MPLTGYPSLCKERQRVIVSRDNGTKREHRAINAQSCSVSQYKIDGGVICDASPRCNFLVMNDDKQEAYLIELKGSDIEHALEQLEATADRLREELRTYRLRYRIVCSRARTQALKSNKFKKFQQKHKGTGEFICQENKIEENI